MQALCKRLEAERLSIFLYGSRAGTIALLRARLRERFPRLEIAGSKPGEYRVLDAGERAGLAKEIKDSGASLTFVGLGCPRQEIWAYENRTALSMPLVCVGAAFDFHAGTVAQAPQALQRAGLEWLFRLAKEPRRLWRRYAYYNPAYVGMIAAQATHLVDFSKRPSHAPQSDTGLA
jgi:N-acetylglucosaminyldiphosphoundecaprenol N-acetyl-beta-D-mannosaminyltransferase